MSLLTFPGVILHELGHILFCRIAGLKVVGYALLDKDFGGHVIHEKPKSVFKQFLVTAGPFFLNTFAAAVFAFIYVFASEVTTILGWFFLWLAFSAGMHSFPSTVDGKSLYDSAMESVRQGKVWNAVFLPLVLLIYAGALLSVVWVDFLYACAVVGGTIALVNAQTLVALPIGNSPHLTTYANENFSFSYPDNFVADQENLEKLRKSAELNSSDKVLLFFARETTFFNDGNGILLFVEDGASEEYANSSLYTTYKGYLEGTPEDKALVEAMARLTTLVPIATKNGSDRPWVIFEVINETGLRKAETSCGTQYVIFAYSSETSITKVQAAVDKIISTFECKVVDPWTVPSGQKIERLSTAARELYSNGLLGNLSEAEFESILTDVRANKFNSPLEIMQAAGKALVYSDSFEGTTPEARYAQLLPELSRLTGEISIEELNFSRGKWKNYGAEYVDVIRISLQSNGATYETDQTFLFDDFIDSYFFRVLNKVLAEKRSAYRFYSAGYGNWGRLGYDAESQHLVAAVLLTSNQAKFIQDQWSSREDFPIRLVSYEEHDLLSASEIDDELNAYRQIGLFDNLSEEESSSAREEIMRTTYPIETVKGMLDYFPRVTFVGYYEGRYDNEPLANLTKQFAVISHGVFDPQQLRDNYVYRCNEFVLIC